MVSRVDLGSWEWHESHEIARDRKRGCSNFFGYCEFVFLKFRFFRKVDEWCSWKTRHRLEARALKRKMRKRIRKGAARRGEIAPISLPPGEIAREKGVPVWRGLSAAVCCNPEEPSKYLFCVAAWIASNLRFRGLWSGDDLLNESRSEVQWVGR